MPLADFAANESEIHLDRRAGLAEFIVDFASDGSAFFFANALETGRQAAKLLERLFELLFGALALGDLHAQLIVHSRENGGALFDAKLEKFFGARERFFPFAALGHVPGKLGEPAQISLGIPQSSKDCVRPEAQAVFADPPSFFFGLSPASRFRQVALRLAV